ASRQSREEAEYETMTEDYLQSRTFTCYAWFTLPNIFSSFCFSTTSAGERPWRPSHETKSFILTSCFTGGCWTMTVTVAKPWPISPTQLSCCKAARAVAIASQGAPPPPLPESSTPRNPFIPTVKVERTTSKSFAHSL